MAPRAIPDDVLYRLKAAARDLIKATGGVVRAGEICGVSKSEAGRWQSPTEPDIIALHQALALEADCGLPIVTTVMADLNGRRLSDPQAAELSAGVFKAQADVMRRVGELAIEAAGAFDDGTLTAAEAEILDRNAASAETSIRHLRGILAGAKVGGGLRVVVGGA